jgi:hypothetical protein
MGGGVVEFFFGEEAQEGSGDESQEEEQDGERVQHNLIPNEPFHIFLDSLNPTRATVARTASEWALEWLKGKLSKKPASTMKII